MTKEELLKIVAEEEPKLGIFTYNGFLCEVKRIEGSGHLCGYVSFSREQLPNIFDHSYESLHDVVECHWGLTYDDKDYKRELRKIGFDCAHCEDIANFINRDGNCLDEYLEFYIENDREYRNYDYVKKNIIGIVDQLIFLNEKDITT